MPSFSEAFAAARKAKGPGKTFTWKGKLFTTDRVDDKKDTKPTQADRPKPNPNRAPSVMTTPPNRAKDPDITSRPIKVKPPESASLIKAAQMAIDR